MSFLKNPYWSVALAPDRAQVLSLGFDASGSSHRCDNLLKIDSSKKPAHPIATVCGAQSGYFDAGALHLSSSCADGQAGRPPLPVALQQLARDREEQRRQGWDGMNHGWAIGTPGWREALARDYAHLSLPRLADARENADFRRSQWTAKLIELLHKTGKGAEDIAKDRKGCPWKVALAFALQQQTSAPSAWIAQQLKMGTAGSLRQYISQLRSKQNQSSSDLHEKNSHLAT